MKLYKKDTKGKIRYLKVYAEGSVIFNESGLLETDSPIIHTKEAKPKNVGRSNATTAEEQAEFEVQSYIKKKLDEGYFKSVSELENTIVVLPILAKDYNKEKRKITWNNCYCQRKFDGNRCLIFVEKEDVRLMSRKGVKIENMFHIEKEIKELNLPVGTILDGELYAHGETFQTNMSYIKKYQEGLTERVKFWLYDIVSDESFVNRYTYILENFNQQTLRNIYLVDTYNINSEEQLKGYHSQFISEGFEGTMVRWGEEGYKVGARSSNLLKYKDFLDMTATIIDIIPSEQRPMWGTPVFDGFKAGVRLSHEEREDLLTNKQDYIGKTAEIRFFEYTDDGKPRFPIMCGIRLDR